MRTYKNSRINFLKTILSKAYYNNDDNSYNKAIYKATNTLGSLGMRIQFFNAYGVLNNVNFNLLKEERPYFINAIISLLLYAKQDKEFDFKVDINNEYYKEIQKEYSFSIFNDLTVRTCRNNNYFIVDKNTGEFYYPTNPNCFDKYKNKNTVPTLFVKEEIMKDNKNRPVPICLFSEYDDDKDNNSAIINNHYKNNKNRKYSGKEVAGKIDSLFNAMTRNNNLIQDKINSIDKNVKELNDKINQIKEDKIKTNKVNKIKDKEKGAHKTPIFNTVQSRKFSKLNYGDVDNFYSIFSKNNLIDSVDTYEEIATKYVSETNNFYRALIKFFNRTNLKYEDIKNYRSIVDKHDIIIMAKEFYDFMVNYEPKAKGARKTININDIMFNFMVNKELFHDYIFCSATKTFYLILSNIFNMDISKYKCSIKTNILFRLYPEEIEDIKTELKKIDADSFIKNLLIKNNMEIAMAYNNKKNNHKKAINKFVMDFMTNKNKQVNNRFKSNKNKHVNKNKRIIAIN